MDGRFSDECNSASLSDKEDDCFDPATLCSEEHSVFIYSERISTKVQHGFDPVAALMSKKGEWWKLYKTKLASLSKTKDNDIIRQIQFRVKRMKEEMCISLPEPVIKLLNYVETDPDKFFWGKYNWYYTGGTLCHVKSREHNLLLYTQGKGRDVLCMSKLQSVPYWQVIASSTKVICPEEGTEIFQVLGRKSCEQVIVGSRQKHKCSLYAVKDTGSGLTFSQLQEFCSTKPFISFDISHHKEQFCTVDTGGLLKVWDLTSSEHGNLHYYCSRNPICDNWRNVHYSPHNESVILLADRKSLILLDVRCNGQSNIVQLECIKSEMNTEEISFVRSSEQDPQILYMGTSSNLALFDRRNLQSVLKKFVHNMSSSPLYCTTGCAFGDRELVFLANQHPGSVQVVCNPKDSTYPLKEALSPTDSLMSYQARGTCLHPSIAPRVSQSLTGLTCLNSNKHDMKELLTQTAAMDVFSQSVFKRQDNHLGRDFSVLTGPFKRLTTPDRWDLTKLYEGLGGKKSFQEKIKTNCKFQKWHLSEVELFARQDALSSIILDTWEIDEPKNTEAKTLTSSDKVNAWLESIGANISFLSSQESFLSQNSLSETVNAPPL